MFGRAFVLLVSDCDAYRMYGLELSGIPVECLCDPDFIEMESQRCNLEAQREEMNAVPLLLGLCLREKKIFESLKEFTSY